MQSDPGIPSRKARKRVLTDKRKEQNRIHQRLYRERKKRQQQEQAPRGEEAQNSSPSNSSGDLLSQDSEVVEVAAVTKNRNKSVHAQSEPLESTPFPETDIDSVDAFREDTLSRFSRDVSAYPEESTTEAPNASGASFMHGLADFFQYMPDHNLPSIGFASELSADPTDEYVDKSISSVGADEQIDALEINQAIETGKLTLQDVLKAGIDAISKRNNPDDGTASSSRVVQRRRQANSAKYQSLAAKSLCDWFASSRSFRLLTDGTPYLADPYMNHLTLDNINIIAACIANATMMGVIVPVPKTFDEAHSPMPSPFSEANKAVNDVDTVQELFAHLSLDLQPSKKQIQEDHDIYVDVLPFPEVRQRILALRTIEPPVFDENELMVDLDNGGLVCWGTRGTGTPWDRRSWEARPWFLQKWWMLTGGEGGELYRQSQWYWNLRGERPTAI